MEMIFFLLKGGFEQPHWTTLDPPREVQCRYFGTVGILGIDILAQ